MSSDFVRSFETMCVRGVDQGVAVRQKDGAFRVLVMGRANAGKTTLLKKICFNIENSEIFSPSGEKVLLYCC
jgi:GTPase SAR1 family protein